MIRQRLTPEQRKQACKLLRTTELSITHIARRLGCSEFPIKQLNRAHQIRPLRQGGGGWHVMEAT